MSTAHDERSEDKRDVDERSEEDLRPCEACPLCGEDVWPATVDRDTGVPWGSLHQAHALCALENLAVRVRALEQSLAATWSAQQSDAL